MAGSSSGKGDFFAAERVRTDVFASLHPVVNFIYFAVVIIAAMFILHPIFLVISFLAAFTYAAYLKGLRQIGRFLLMLLPFVILMSLVNPLFNHRGATILFYFQNGNPVTLESIIYGAVTGLVVITVICWFSCYNLVMTSDKFVYLFGRVIPVLSLIFSMALRFVPKFAAQMKVVTNAQRCIGRSFTDGSLLQRAKNGVKIISIMLTWALENAVDTADSMKARGYGLHGRTAFSIFRFDRRDALITGGFALLLVLLLVGFGVGVGSVDYFPIITVDLSPDGFSVLIYIVYALFCLMPVMLNVWEDRRWKLLQSKI